MKLCIWHTDLRSPANRLSTHYQSGVLVQRLCRPSRKWGILVHLFRLRVACLRPIINRSYTVFMRLFYVYGLPQVSRSAPLQSPPVRYAETASALTVEAKYHSHPFAGGQRPWPFCWGSEGEAPVRMREKLSKVKPRDIKGVVCRGLPWVLFWPEIYLPDLD